MSDEQKQTEKKPMDKDAARALSKEVGREYAVQLMHDAVSSAKNVEQMNNQLAVLTSFGTHILATQIYNAEKNGEVTREEATDYMIKLLREETAFIYNTAEKDMELHKIKGAENGAGEAAQKVEGTPNEPA